MNIKTAVFHCSAIDLESCPEVSLPEFAFIGRSNVGKSSLLNALTGKADLAKVSKTPGHTKTINFFTINKVWRLVDLPGYGFAQVARENKQKFNHAVNNYLINRENLAGVFVLIDSRHAPQKIDLDFLSWLATKPVSVVLVFTKIDASTPEHVEKNMELFKESIKESFEELPDIFSCSSVTGRGLPQLLGVIESALESIPKEKRVVPKAAHRRTPW